MEKIFIIIMICCMGIFHISDAQSECFNGFQEENSIDEFESLPFQVMVDKTSLETGRSEKVTCYVVSAVDDFSYSVCAEKGKIRNKNSLSFDYFKPEEELTDTVRLECTDKTTGRVYSFSIHFIFADAMPIVETDDLLCGE